MNTAPASPPDAASNAAVPLDALAARALPCPFCGECLVVITARYARPVVTHRDDMGACIMEGCCIETEAHLREWNVRPAAASVAAPLNAILHEGVWLPAGETHLQTVMRPGAKRFRRDAEGRACYQLHKLEAALAFLPADRRRRAVDVGAHVGLWSRHLAGAFAMVHAFEPVAAHRALFPFNVAAGNLVLHACALGSAPGSVTIAGAPGSSGDSHVTGEGDIPLRTLDAFDLDAVDFVKIDVEGFELQVCQGAVDTLRRCRPLVVVEQKGKEAAHFGRPPGEAAEFLRGLGMVDLMPPIAGDHILGFPELATAGQPGALG